MSDTATSPKKAIDITDIEPIVIVGQPQPYIEAEPATVLQRILARLIDWAIIFLMYLVLNITLVTGIIIANPKAGINYINWLEKVQEQSEKIGFFESIENYKQCYDISQEICQSVLQTHRNLSIFLAISAFIISTLYYILLSVYLKATFGKKIMHIQVVNLVGKKISFLQSFAREIFWIMYGLIQILLVFQPNLETAIQVITIAITVDLTRLNFDKEQMSIHDYIAQTKVVQSKV